MGKNSNKRKGTRKKKEEHKTAILEPEEEKKKEEADAEVEEENVDASNVPAPTRTGVEEVTVLDSTNSLEAETNLESINSEAVGEKAEKEAEVEANVEAEVEVEIGEEAAEEEKETKADAETEAEANVEAEVEAEADEEEEEEKEEEAPNTDAKETAEKEAFPVVEVEERESNFVDVELSAEGYLRKKTKELESITAKNQLHVSKIVRDLNERGIGLTILTNVPVEAFVKAAARPSKSPSWVTGAGGEEAIGQEGGGSTFEVSALSPPTFISSGENYMDRALQHDAINEAARFENLTVEKFAADVVEEGHRPAHEMVSSNQSRATYDIHDKRKDMATSAAQDPPFIDAAIVKPHPSSQEVDDILEVMETSEFKGKVANEKIESHLCVNDDQDEEQAVVDTKEAPSLEESTPLEGEVLAEPMLQLPVPVPVPSKEAPSLEESTPLEGEVLAEPMLQLPVPVSVPSKEAPSLEESTPLEGEVLAELMLQLPVPVPSKEAPSLEESTPLEGEVLAEPMLQLPVPAPSPVLLTSQNLEEEKPVLTKTSATAEDGLLGWLEKELLETEPQLEKVTGEAFVSDPIKEGHRPVGIASRMEPIPSRGVVDEVPPEKTKFLEFELEPKVKEKKISLEFDGTPTLQPEAQKKCCACAIM